MSPSIKEEPINTMEEYVTQNADSRQTSFSSGGTTAEHYHHQTEAQAAAAVAAAVEAATNNMDDVVNSLVEQNIWPTTTTESTAQHHQVAHPLDSTALMLNSWDPNSFSTSANLKASAGDWDLGAALQHPGHPHQETNYTLAAAVAAAASTATGGNNLMPQTPPVTSTSFHPVTTNAHAEAEAASTAAAALLDSLNNFNYSSAPESMANTALSTPNSGLVTPPMTNYFTPHRSSTASMHKKIASTASAPYNINNRRCSSVDISKYGNVNVSTTPTGRRASSHPSVASVVSLTAHEPVSKIIDGIEYITFLYSHDRLVKEYTVKTDVDNVDINDITMDFRIQNAIYPRANVDRSEYDGNRWDYETTCNQLGWKLCWLNKEKLFGRRGLIQRAVDSYRNRHAEMRSRRVTRQEKVANGTLRKRRSKKSLSTNTTTHLL